MRQTSRHYGSAPIWDPKEGVTILHPESEGGGYWVGAPSVTYDADRGTFLMTYRRRRPRGEGAERGWFGAVAESADGIHFQDIWTVHKDDLGTPSMERFCLVRDGGRYLLYLSYVDPTDNRWRIDVIEADRPDGFDVKRRQNVCTAASTDTEGVKDPYVFKVGPLWYMIISYAKVPRQARADMHETADIYNTGATTCPVAMATSRDGINWSWQGEILGVGQGWDRYGTRLNSVLHVGPCWVGFYDGLPDESHNYEEHCGIAISYDLRHWERVTPDGPWVVGPHGSKSVRYVDVVPVKDELWIYYEMTRADGAHELRLNRVPQ